MIKNNEFICHAAKYLLQEDCVITEESHRIVVQIIPKPADQTLDQCARIHTFMQILDRFSRSQVCTIFNEARRITIYCRTFSGESTFSSMVDLELYLLRGLATNLNIVHQPDEPRRYHNQWISDPNPSPDVFKDGFPAGQLIIRSATQLASGNGYMGHTLANACAPIKDTPDNKK